MLKPGPNYRMSKQSKRFAATILDPHKRGEFLRTTVQADLYGSLPPPKRDKKPKGAGFVQTDSENE
jgi:hypothetical protein